MTKRNFVFLMLFLACGFIVYKITNIKQSSNDVRRELEIVKVVGATQGASNKVESATQPVGIDIISSRQRLLGMLSDNTFPKRGDKEWSQFVTDFVENTIADPNFGLQILNASLVGQPQRDVVALHMFYAQALAQTNPQKAIQWSKSIQDSPTSVSCLGATFEVWLRLPGTDPSSVLDSLNEFKKSKWASSNILGALKLLSPEKAEAWVNDNLRNDPKIYFPAVVGIFKRAGELAPEKLLAMIESYDLGSRRLSVVRDAVSGLSSENLDNAIAFVKLSFNKDYGPAAFEGLVSRSFMRDPDQMLDMVNVVAPQEAAKVLSSGISEWLRSDFEKAHEWVSNQPHNFKVQLATTGIPAQLAHTSPTSAISFIEDLHLDADTTTAHYQRIIEAWTGDDPAGSIKWLSGQSAMVQTQLISSFVGELAREDTKLIAPFLETSGLTPEAVAEGKRRMGTILAK